MNLRIIIISIVMLLFKLNNYPRLYIKEKSRKKRKKNVCERKRKRERERMVYFQRHTYHKHIGWLKNLSGRRSGWLFLIFWLAHELNIYICTNVYVCICVCVRMHISIRILMYLKETCYNSMNKMWEINIIVNADT